MSGINSHKNGRLYISDMPVNDDLDQAAYEALTWILVGGTTTVPDIGPTENIISIDCLEGVAQKAKGNSDAGDPEFPYKRDVTDPGQIKLVEAAQTEDCWGLRVEYGDERVGFTRSNAYTRGVVTRPRIIGGGGDDFILTQVTWGLSQLPLVVDPEVV